MMSWGEFQSTLVIFILWFIIPVGILVSAYLHKRFMSTFGLCYYILSIPIIGWYEGFAFSIAYMVALLVFVIWWATVFQKYKENNPKNYEAYRRFYSEYFSDDLNNDGIKDAFEHWEIAHDPRFFWLFGSRRAKQERSLDSSFIFGSSRSGAWGAFGTTKSPEQEFNEWSSRQKNGEFYRNSTTSTGANRQGQAYAGRQNTGNTTGQASYGTKPESEMSDVEREVARQHEFARRHNLRYFAMCKSKAEAKKLYHKYATKFHPDNAVTGDKEKFMRIDEEYNRFCAIDEVS